MKHGSCVRKPQVHCLWYQFDDASYQQNGHIQVDFGLDTPFLYEEVDFTSILEQRIKANVHKLVNFTSAVENNCGISAACCGQSQKTTWRRS